MIRQILFLFTCFFILSAQTTRVVTLEPADADLLSQKYAAMQKAQAEFYAADKYVKHKYGPALKREGEGDVDVSAVEYSEGFRHMVRSAGDARGDEGIHFTFPQGSCGGSAEACAAAKSIAWR